MFFTENWAATSFSNRATTPKFLVEMGSRVIHHFKGLFILYTF